jgi:hypothetical protein
MTMAAASGCSLDFSQTGRQRQNLRLDQSGGGNYGRHPRLAFGERPGFINDESVDLLHALKGFSRLNQDASARALPDRHADRHRGSEAQRAGTGDDDDGDRRDQRIGKRGSRTKGRPRGEGENGNAQHRRNK